MDSLDELQQRVPELEDRCAPFAMRSLRMPAVSTLDTTHTVTNPRVGITGDRATTLALVKAQHLSRRAEARFRRVARHANADRERLGRRRWRSLA